MRSSSSSLFIVESAYIICGTRIFELKTKGIKDFEKEKPTLKLDEEIVDRQMEQKICKINTSYHQQYYKEI
jgi:hypothetical protein